MNHIKYLFILVCLIATSAKGNAQVVEKKTITLDGAMQIINAAKDYARKHDAPGGVIAVVDDGGNLVALERIDGTFAAGANISIGKARTAVIFKKPTKFFEDVIRTGRTPMVALNDFTPLQGGVPIIIDGQVVGGVGVSGAASAQQDEELAIAGANAVTSSSIGTSGVRHQEITYVDKERVSAAFAKGMPLLEFNNYKIHASRREGPGMAEVHNLDTDIIYVLEGSADFVTGGTVVEGKTIAPDEIRGKEIKGGDQRKIVKGDVIVVPAGTPHWFKQVNAPLLYYVVKVS
ncbi:MAG: heme-binding protein [Thermodesulfobacteriota bacterium]